MPTIFAFLLQIDGHLCPVVNYSSEVNETIRILPDAHTVENDENTNANRDADETQ